MKAIGIVVESTWRVLCIAFIVLLIRSCFKSSSVRGYIKLETRVSMLTIAECLKEATKHAGSSNVIEYVKKVTDTQNIPQDLNQKALGQIFSAYPVFPVSFHGGELFDEWGNSIRIILTTNHIGEAGVIMHSFGKNKRNENGGGDDIVMWFNADMSPSPEDAQKSRIWLEECLKGLYNPPQ